MSSDTDLTVGGDRATTRTFTLPGGTRVRTYRLPKGFDPATASDADLVLVGLPLRPDDPTQQARYDRIRAKLVNRSSYVTAEFRVNSHITHGPRRTGADAGTEVSGNWSGGVVYAPSGATFKTVGGDWVVPNVDAPTENQWYYAASWVGIDGDGSGDVCQAGVECEAYRSGSSISRNIYPWWEWYPESEVQITNLPINPGDLVTVTICTLAANNVGPGAGSTSASLFFNNQTTGAYTSLTFYAPAGTSLAGNSAEWIVEAPTVNGAQSAIADYGQVFFTQASATLTNNTYAYGGTGNNINLESGGKEVSAGNLITNSIVECAYVGPTP